ncbi:hypothetical protein [Brevibacterium litoralis]|uniref:hypothetical protein n=1 Tax=Brevibacterium litoralis TaxID=3138935 RepID=UPI0032EBE1B4
MADHFGRAALPIPGPALYPRCMATQPAPLVAALRAVRADLAFVSPDRLDREGLVFNSFDDAEVIRTMATRAATTVALADASKYSAGGAALALRWSRLDRIVTDTLPSVLVEPLGEAGVAVTRAG